MAQMHTAFQTSKEIKFNCRGKEANTENAQMQYWNLIPNTFIDFTISVARIKFQQQQKNVIIRNAYWFSLRTTWFMFVITFICYQKS